MDESGTERNGRDHKQRASARRFEDCHERQRYFVGVSAPNIVTSEMVSTMADDAIVFAMANPTPEIMPDEAKKGGAKVVATGRSDFPNQINNVLVFMVYSAVHLMCGQVISMKR